MIPTHEVRKPIYARAQTKVLALLFAYGLLYETPLGMFCLYGKVMIDKITINLPLVVLVDGMVVLLLAVLYAFAAPFSTMATSSLDLAIPKGMSKSNPTRILLRFEIFPKCDATKR